MTRWLFLWLVLGAVACGPSVSPSDEGAAPSTSTVDATAESDTEADESAHDSTGASGLGTSTGAADEASTSAGEDSATGEHSDCGAGDPLVGCPTGCMDVTAYLGTGDDIDFASGLRSCVPAGATIEATYRSAWWRDDGTQRRFLLAGHGCGAQIHAAPLGDWHECGAFAEEPAECDWLCAQDVCPGEVDWTELSACNAPSPCPSSAHLYACEPLDPDLVCVHESLADRVPGRYDIEFAYPNFSSSWTLVVAADGSVQVTSKQNDTLGGCGPGALNGIWTRSQTCDLAPAGFFAACAQAQTWCGGDLDPCQSETLSGWLLDCVETPPSC